MNVGVIELRLGKRDRPAKGATTMTLICLVRHGETDWNREGRLQGKTDIPLNSVGVLQAGQCRDYLANEQWDAVISSPLARAKQTALIINEKIQLPFSEEKAFIERDYGDAEGLSIEERLSKFPDKKYPNQEDRSALIDRILLGLEEIVQEWPNKRIILVAHGAVINAILSILSNGEIGSSKTVLGNACLSEIEFDEGRWVIHFYNDTDYLALLNKE